MKAATYLDENGNEIEKISIHAAREGGDALNGRMSRECRLFQSTPSVKAATDRNAYAADFLTISIHAVREGGDIGSTFIIPDKAISIHAVREGGDQHC